MFVTKIDEILKLNSLWHQIEGKVTKCSLAEILLQNDSQENIDFSSSFVVRLLESNELLEGFTWCNTVLDEFFADYRTSNQIYQVSKTRNFSLHTCSCPNIVQNSNWFSHISNWSHCSFHNYETFHYFIS